MGRTKELYQEQLERDQNFRRDEEEYEDGFWEQVQKQTKQEINSSNQ